MFSFLTRGADARRGMEAEEKNFILLSARGVSALSAEYEDLERQAADLYQENLTAAQDYETAVAKALEEYRAKMLVIAQKTTVVTEKQAICYESIRHLGVSVTA